MQMTTAKMMRLFNDETITERVKLEDFWTVALGTRPLSLLSLPADFPDSQRLKEAVEQGFITRYYDGYSQGGLAGWLQRIQYWLRRRRQPPIAYQTSLFHDAFEEVILEHEQYLGLLRWQVEFGLASVQQAVQPGVEEMLVYRDESVLAKIVDLIRARALIREREQSDDDTKASANPFAPPEHADPQYVEGIGDLLGYPSCCIEAFTDEVRRGQESGLRSAKQINETDRVASDAFFASHFYPCTPDCPKAKGKGRTILDRLATFDGRLARRMERIYRSNIQLIKQYPRVVERRRNESMQHGLKVVEHESL